VGAVNDEKKKYYLQRSRALLFPIKWQEPFGIVMVEALACGTPVIAFNRGAVPEVIENGKNGYIVNNIDEMVESISKVSTLEHDKIRADTVSRFSLENITKEYLDVFKRAKAR
jgi:glycosyltransferase involved in cell wall biosynthesis